MERFTNNPEQLRQQLLIELFDYVKTENTHAIFTYGELSALFLYGYSLHGYLEIDSQEIKWKEKVWKADYDFQRFRQGIFNIDRLAVVEKDSARAVDLTGIPWGRLATQTIDGIILDGAHCELRILQPKQTLIWNVDEEMNNELASFIKLVRRN